VQRIDAEDDLLERAMGDDAGEDGISLETEGVPTVGPGASEARNQDVVRQRPRYGASLAERAGELVSMPALSRAQNRDVRRNEKLVFIAPATASTLQRLAARRGRSARY
jgi:hypothetical protein